MLPIVLALAMVGADAEIRAEKVKLTTETGELAGTLDLPAGKGPFPVVLIHPGSGPTDRDGNAPLGLKCDALLLLGKALAGHGIACLRIDKRGVGESAKALGKEENATIDAYATDAAAWIEFLRKDKRSHKVAFLGHSEGAIVGLLACQKSPVDAYVSVCGPGRRMSDVLREQLKGKLEALAEKNEAILKSLETGEKIADVPKELQVLYRPSVQPFLISIFKIDPPKEIARLKCPILVVQGTADIQVSLADADKLAGAKKGIDRLTIPDMNHVFKTVTDPKDQLKAYTDPSLPLAPKVADGIAKFVKDHLRDR